MFQVLFEKTPVSLNDTTIYQILSKDASTIADDDLTKLATLVGEISEMEGVDKGFLLEETMLSLYIFLNDEEGIDEEQFKSSCEKVFGAFAEKYSENELNTLIDCLGIFKNMSIDPIDDLQGFYEDLEEKLQAFSSGRYCTNMFRRRFLDTIIQTGGFSDMREAVKAMSNEMLALSEDELDKTVILTNEFFLS